MTSLEKNIRFFIGTSIGNSTSLFKIVNKKREDKYIASDSDICIEGFQRSGNSFFVLLFKRRNKSIKIAHHTHAAAQVIKAIGYQIPTIVLIRKPEDAIASLVVWDEKLSVSNALRAWISFYQTLYKIKDDIQITTFEEVTENPAGVIRQCNDRFKTNFEPPVFSEEDLKKIKAGVHERNKPLSAPLPTIEKDRAKDKYYKSIKAHVTFPRANKIYQNYLNHINS